MAKRKKRSLVKNLVTTAGVLVVAQVIFLMVFGGQKQVTIKDAIDKAATSKPNLSDKRREQIKIQLAIADFMGKNNGAPPSKLDDLVPTYFDNLPVDPETGHPFPYSVQGKRYTLGENPATLLAGLSVNGEAPPSPEQQKLLIASLDQPADSKQFVYDPTGKRDPFMPFDFAPKNTNDTGTPLERYSLGQLRLTAVLNGGDEPAALVEDATGKGFTVRKGTKIGNAGGEVVDILPDKILILETATDFTGEKKSTTSELKIRTKDEEKNANNPERHGGPKRKTK
jgi:Tfp pilus assembly protein PilP